MKGCLYLEDGTVFHGRMFGDVKTSRGEVVFNTGMTGYQELLTDPSYVNQMVILTYPQIGNYGFNQEDVESASPKVSALIIRELCREPSNFRAEGELDDYFRQHGITGIEGVDTRALTLHIREAGSMKGLIVPENGAVDMSLLNQPLPDPVNQVTSREIWKIGDENGRRIALMDFGVKGAILHSLVARGFHVTVYPAGTNADRILQDTPVGIVLSNGPGNPMDLPEAVEAIGKIMEKRVPMMGICLGHQLISLASGAKTKKLTFGHRGGNHPVKNLITGKVTITSQNHSFVVDEDTLPDSLVVSHINLNDDTIEGLQHRYLPVFSVQYHPEASPGPADSSALFEDFQDLIEKEGTGCHEKMV